MSLSGSGESAESFSYISAESSASLPSPDKSETKPLE